MKTYEQYQVKYKAFFEAQAAYAPKDSTDWGAIAKSFIEEIEASQKRFSEHRREEELKNLSAENIGAEISLLLGRLEPQDFPVALEAVLSYSGEEVLKEVQRLIDVEIEKRKRPVGTVGELKPSKKRKTK